MRISDWSSDVCSSDLRRQQFAALVVEGAVIPGPDMFEHADRNDAVEGAVDVAIVDQFEAHMVGHARILRPLPRDLELLLRPGDAGHVHAAGEVQLQRHAAPAAAYVTQEERRVGKDCYTTATSRLPPTYHNK